MSGHFLKKDQEVSVKLNWMTGSAYKLIMLVKSLNRKVTEGLCKRYQRDLTGIYMSGNTAIFIRHQLDSMALVCV